MGYFSLPFILLEDISNMNEYKIITLRERPELVAIAAEWFLIVSGACRKRHTLSVWKRIYRENRVWLVSMLI